MKPGRLTSARGLVRAGARAVTREVVAAAMVVAISLSPVAWADTPVTTPSTHHAPNPLIGGWKADTYFLKDGSTYPLLGQIIFGEKNWSVLYIVLQDGKPQRGSGEGGDYVLDGKNLTFIHHFMISTLAPAIPGLKEQPMRSLQWEKDLVEPASFEVVGDRMTLFMPSGNRLTWTRSSM